jgi:hypothetical protein
MAAATYCRGCTRSWCSPGLTAAVVVVFLAHCLAGHRLPARLGPQCQKVVTARQRAAARSKALHLRTVQAQALSSNRSQIRRPHSSAAVAVRSQMQQPAAAAWVEGSRPVAQALQQ